MRDRQGRSRSDLSCKLTWAEYKHWELAKCFFNDDEKFASIGVGVRTRDTRTKLTYPLHVRLGCRHGVWYGPNVGHIWPNMGEWCIGNIEASQALAPDKTRNVKFDLFLG